MIQAKRNLKIQNFGNLIEEYKRDIALIRDLLINFSLNKVESLLKKLKYLQGQLTSIEDSLIQDNLSQQVSRSVQKRIENFCAEFYELHNKSIREILKQNVHVKVPPEIQQALLPGEEMKFSFFGKRYWDAPLFFVGLILITDRRILFTLYPSFDKTIKKIFPDRSYRDFYTILKETCDEAIQLSEIHNADLFLNLNRSYIKYYYRNHLEAIHFSHSSYETLADVRARLQTICDFLNNSRLQSDYCFCPYCGTQIISTDNFCDQCGNEII